MNRKVLLTSLLYIVLSTGAFAQSLGIKVPAQDTQRLSIENLNFTAAGFMAAYMSAEQDKTIQFPPEGLEDFVPAVAKGEWNPDK